MKRKFEIPYELSNGISFLAAILGIPSSILGIVSFIIMLSNGEISVPIFIFFSVIFLLAIICLARFLKCKKLLACLSRTYPESFDSFMSNCRDCYFEIIKRNSLYKNQSQKDKIEDLSAFIENKTEKLLDNICEIFEKVTNEKICACIKLIPSIEEGEPLLIQTLSRSSNTDKDRRIADNEALSLLGNTDFEHIFDKGHRYFYSQNLEKLDRNLVIAEGEGYENNSPNYTDNTKRYNSTIVVPLKVDKSHLDDESVNDRLIGFLCIDSLSTNAFREDGESLVRNIQLLEAFAASLFIILEKYQYYLSN